MPRAIETNRATATNRVEGEHRHEPGRARRNGGTVGLAPVRRSNPNEVIPVGRGRKAANKLDIGDMPDGRSLVVGRDGRFVVGGKKVATNGEALAIYRAAQIGGAPEARGGFIQKLGLSVAAQETFVSRLIETLEGSVARKKSEIADKGFTGSMSLLLSFANGAPRGQGDLAERALDAALTGLEKSKNPEHAAFYLLSFEGVANKLNAAQKARLSTVEARVLPSRPLVEEYTDNRKKPLEVRHTIHPEFWREELRMFSAANGFKLVHKNAKDTERRYSGVIPDPTGKHEPLKINLVVKKDELDYLESMSDPNVHVILYSGHSAVGGNGSQAIQAAGRMAGKTPKLVMAANCRGKDNYAEFTNKWPTAHAIMTEHPTYSDSGQARVKALFDTLARGEDYKYMRKTSEGRYWDEPSNNYFYPDEKRKYRFMDADEDGRFDLAKIGTDRVFDVDADVASGKFLRALNFANSQMFYHWEVDAENYERSHYSKAFADCFDTAGVFKDAKPGELLRVEELPKKRGAKQRTFAVKYNPDLAKKIDQNVLGGHVTAHAVMALAIARDGELTKREALRAVLMGAQGVHYLDVYFESSPISYKRYFSDLGLTKAMKEADIENIFNKFDAHANDAQLDAFIAMLKDKYKVDVDAWQPMLKGEPVVV